MGKLRSKAIYGMRLGNVVEIIYGVSCGDVGKPSLVLESILDWGLFSNG
jgi:hypothetical protein